MRSVLVDAINSAAKNMKDWAKPYFCDDVDSYQEQHYFEILLTGDWLRTRSGVATGWHGRTMSRGPGAKGAPRKRDTKKKKEKEKENEAKKRKKSKEKKKRKERTKLFKYPNGSRPTRYIPMSLSRWQKISKSNIGNHHTIFEIWDEQWGTGGSCFFFSLHVI